MKKLQFVFAGGEEQQGLDTALRAIGRSTWLHGWARGSA